MKTNDDTLWKICGAGLAAASAFVVVATAACLLSGYFQIAAIVLLAGMVGMAAAFGLIWLCAIVAHDEMLKK